MVHFVAKCISLLHTFVIYLCPMKNIKLNFNKTIKPIGSKNSKSFPVIGFVSKTLRKYMTTLANDSSDVSPSLSRFYRIPGVICRVVVYISIRTGTGNWLPSTVNVPNDLYRLAITWGS